MKRIKRLHSALIEAALLPVKFYRKFISPNKIGGHCKYLPTCSAYCMEAFREWGIFCGFFLSAFRILRCNPFSKGGYDPVPKRKRKKSYETENPEKQENSNP